MLNHNLKPLFEVFLHAHSASLQQVLNPFDLCLQVLQLCILCLVSLLVLVDLTLQLIFLLSAHKLSIVINHASQRILLSNLLDLVRQVLDHGPCLVDILTKLLASRILIF